MIQCSRILSFATPLLAALTLANPNLATLSLTATPQEVVKDINTVPISSSPGGSSPSEPSALSASESLLSLYTLNVGHELWKTDGTSGGLTLVKDIASGQLGSEPDEFATLPNGRAVFAATTLAEGREPWVTDGTSTGTNLLSDLAPGSTHSAPKAFTSAAGFVWFFATSSGVTQLYRTDGTSAGTVPILSGFHPLQSKAIAPLGTTEIMASLRVGTDWQVWKSDGSIAGTSLVHSFGAFGVPRDINSLGNRVVFTVPIPGQAGNSMWTSDGTPSGTVNLGGFVGTRIQTVGGLAYFGAAASNGQLEPFRTDGTLAGTFQLQDIGVSVSGSPRFLGALGASVIFTATATLGVRSLWVSDGTIGGTLMIGAAGGPNSFGPDLGAELGGYFYFASQTPALGLWRTDGTTAGTSLVAPINITSPYVRRVGNRVAFPAHTLAHGENLWSSDGTLAGTQFIDNLPPPISTRDSNPVIVTRHRDAALVIANDEVHGAEPWISDGTNPGTFLLIDSVTGIDAPSADRWIGDSTGELLMFSAQELGETFDPWISDGTSAGTTQLALGAQHPGFQVHKITALDDRFLLNAYTDSQGNEPWVSDGTVAGTVPLGDLYPGATSGCETTEPARAPFFFVHGQSAYFVASTPSQGRELWVTDGTQSGTRIVFDTTPGPVDGARFDLAELGDYVLFPGSDLVGGYEPWITDGTPAGTSKLADLQPGSSSSDPRRFVSTRDRVFFLANINGNARLAVSDGTSQGTFALPSPMDRVQAVFPLDENRVLAFRLDAAFDWSSWISDGTPAGTSLLGSVGMSSGLFGVRGFRLTEDQLLMTWIEALGDTTLFAFDGTAPGGRRLFDTLQNPYAETPTRTGDRILFVARDPHFGRELHSVPLSLIGDETVEKRGFGAAGSNGVVPTISLDGQADASSPSPMGIVLNDVLASTPVFLIWSRGLVASPIAGAVLWTDAPSFIELGVSDATGQASFGFQPNASLAGQRFVSQGFALDPQGTALGIASATPALEIVFGP